MALSAEEIKRIHIAGTAIPNKEYFSTDGRKYKGTLEKRLKEIENTSGILFSIEELEERVSDTESEIDSIQIELDTKVDSVTGLNTDNTDPNNPIIQISVDGITITGAGTPGSPLSVGSVVTTEFKQDFLLMGG